MIDLMTIRKTQQANAILDRCIGTHGVWADPTRYRYQCWTRDFALAILPVLIERKQFEIAKRHLVELSKRQRSNGQIPILFLDNTLPFFVEKMKKSFREGKLSFMLRRFLSGNLWNLTPGTHDSELHYLISMHEYAFASGDNSLTKLYSDNIDKALRYIESHLMREGLIHGCDWRDMMEAELCNSTLLTNNALLYAVFSMMHKSHKALHMQLRVNMKFWNGTSYQDAPDRERFDPLGGALAILHGVVPKDRYQSLADSFRSVDSTRGVTIQCKHNPFSPEEREVIDRTDGVVVWPFVVGFAVLALLKMGEVEFAQEQFKKLQSLDGFREWYDPGTGKGYGAKEQLWSATLYLRAAATLEKQNERIYPS